MHACTPFMGLALGLFSQSLKAFSRISFFVPFEISQLWNVLKNRIKVMKMKDLKSIFKSADLADTG